MVSENPGLKTTSMKDMFTRQRVNGICSLNSVETNRTTIRCVLSVSLFLLLLPDRYKYTKTRVQQRLGTYYTDQVLLSHSTCNNELVSW